jgi:hypothetical protein
VFNAGVLEKMLRKIFGPKREKIKKTGEKLHSE